MSKLRERLTYANVVSTLCLCILLGGSAYAATRLPNNSVGTKQLKKGAVSLSKIKPSAISAIKGQKGERGDRGPQGEAGHAGQDATRLFARIVASNGFAAVKSGVTEGENTGLGTYSIDFTSDLSNCALQVTTGVGIPVNPGDIYSDGSGATVRVSAADSSVALVATTDEEGTPANVSFFIAAFC